MNNQSLVTVIIPCYNAAGFVRQAVDSAIAQTYENIEILCIDDGSKDDTLGILESYGDKIKLLRHPGGANKGQWASVNVAVRQARGEYVAFLDSDDIWTKDKIAAQVDALETCRAGLVYTDAVCVDSAGTWYNRRLADSHIEENSPEKLLLDCYIVNSSVMVRKSILEDFDETLQAADHDMWLRLIEKCTFMYLNEPLTGYRSWGGQISYKRRQWEDGFVILKKTMARRKYDRGAIRKREAVLRYRLGTHDIANRKPISGLCNLVLSGLCDPSRALKHLAGL